MGIETRPRNERKNTFEDFSLLFAGSKVYIADKAYPLGEMTAELLNYPDENLIDLRDECAKMFIFANDEFLSPNAEKNFALAHAMQDKINKVLEIIYDMPLFDKLNFNRDIDFSFLPIMFDESVTRFKNLFIDNSDENIRSTAYLYKLATLADEVLSFKAYLTVMVSWYFEDLKRRDSEHYALAMYYFFSNAEMQSEIADLLPPTPFQFFKQSRNAEFEYTTLPNPENKEKYMVGEQIVFHNYVTFFHVDFFRGLMHGNTPRLCQNCDRFFLLANSYDAIYCNRIAPGEETKTCRKVGAHRKAAGASKTPAQKMYDTVYNRLKQRHLRQRITRDEWNDAVAKALEYKDMAESGKLTGLELQEIYDKM